MKSKSDNKDNDIHWIPSFTCIFICIINSSSYDEISVTSRREQAPWHFPVHRFIVQPGREIFSNSNPIPIRFAISSSYFLLILWHVYMNVEN